MSCQGFISTYNSFYRLELNLRLPSAQTCRNVSPEDCQNHLLANTPPRCVPFQKHWLPFSFHISFSSLGFFPSPAWPTQGAHKPAEPTFPPLVINSTLLLEVAHHRVRAEQKHLFEVWRTLLKLTGWFVFKLNNLWDRPIRQPRKERAKLTAYGFVCNSPQMTGADITCPMCSQCENHNTMV